VKGIIIFFRNRDFPANHLEVIDNSSNSTLKWERFARLKLEDNKSFLGRPRQEEAVPVLLNGRVRLRAYTRSLLGCTDA